MRNNFILVLLFFSVRSFAVQGEVCSFFYNLEKQMNNNNSQIITEMLDRFRTQTANKILQPLTDTEIGYYFTVDRGYYFNLDCQDLSEPGRLSETGMFAIGDRFKPVKKIKFNGNDYYYGIRSSGLMSFVRVDKTRKIETDKVYFVNRTLEKSFFCTNENNCSGVSKEFSIRNHYAVMGKKDFIYNGGCKKFNVQVYQRNEEKGSELIIPFPNTINSIQYCNTNDIFKFDHVDTEVFFDGTPIVGHLVLLSSKELKKLIPNISDVKNCDEKIVQVKSELDRIKLNFGLDLSKIYAKFSSELEHEIESKYEVIRTLDRGVFIKFLSFSIESSKMKILNDNDILIVELMQTCDKHVKKPVDFANATFNINADKEIEVDIDREDLTKEARTKGEDGNKFVDWVIETQSKPARKNGQTWIIRGIRQHIEWRDFIQHKFEEQLVEFLDEDDLIYKDRMARYFTMLFMSTSFIYIKDEGAN
ncbi:hypothetical protein C9J01_18940 [Photobacterium rosenbergii]|uniref:Uncharacterized protein n=1 Tax=Photobacterium rosenbergii TaxID=294936 RepID=A0A2T3N9U1_9GAMM|nr:hypothetical protein [Photobacterium rosenbergii]PSW10288.1 hypothetical protein C9J01_18940 [Photobacterium rosenbergii]